MSSGNVAPNTTATTGPAIKSTDKYVWGSVTKMVTGVSIIRLANEGVFGLHDKVAPILDPYFEKQGWLFKGEPITMQTLWWSQANDVTIWQLATMTSGVLDFDTAKPSECHCPRPLTLEWTDVDPFRATVYKTASKEWSPTRPPHGTYGLESAHLANSTILSFSFFA